VEVPDPASNYDIGIHHSVQLKGSIVAWYRGVVGSAAILLKQLLSDTATPHHTMPLRILT
jgi:hypothetical protein